MQRYHLPIISLGIVSTLVLYVILTQQRPFLTNTETFAISLNIMPIIYFATAVFMVTFSWVTLLWYVIGKMFHPQVHPRLLTRAGLKAGVLVSVGICGTLMLRVTQTLNIVTGVMLWLTVLAIAWTVKRKD